MRQIPRAGTNYQRFDGRRLEVSAASTGICVRCTTDVPDTLLHWHCEGVTYSIKRLPGNRGFLIVTGPGEAVRHGKRPLPEALISEWAKLPIPERCTVVNGEIARRRGEESN